MPKQLDIRTLLKAALDDTPSKDLSEGVLSRLAAVKTAVEMSRLVGVAPSSWASRSKDDGAIEEKLQDESNSQKNDEENENE